MKRPHDLDFEIDKATQRRWHNEPYTERWISWELAVEEVTQRERERLYIAVPATEENSSKT